MRKTLSAHIAPADAAPDSAGQRPSSARLDRLKERARALRRDPTDAEKRLWSRLSEAQLGGLKFSRKAVVGSVIADFACPARWLVVSISGPELSPEVEALQDRKLTDAGIRVLRFSEDAVMTDLDGVVREITAMTNAPFERPRASTGAAPRGGRTASGRN